MTSTHCGTYRVRIEDHRITELRAFEHDPDPSPIGPGIVDVLESPTRIMAPIGSTVIRVPQERSAVRMNS
ncbi:MAG: hypothetical protein ABJM43_21775 [Paracoccaceae bacterium]|uniref:hypothetical protein n=1 Tax=Pseudophaeobacter sp. TaxID=1971739 RepID=UPI0032992F29